MEGEIGEEEGDENAEEGEWKALSLSLTLVSVISRLSSIGTN
jgi:hypothetical protein